MRGVGKSYIGKQISKQLKLPFFDTDTAIEQEELQKITEIIKEHGWDYFRKKESNVLKKLAKMPPSVVATGGGAPLSKENQEILQGNEHILWIYANLEDIIQRLENDNSRPSLNGKKIKHETQEIYEKREPIYNQVSNYRLISYTSSKSLENEIMKFIKHFKKV